MLVLTSWDDGHPLDLRIAEMLNKHGLAGTFFVPVENREGKKVMESADLRLLVAAGAEVGGHTLSHCYLNKRLGDRVVTREIAEGKQVIEDCLGHAIAGFCYPGGRFDSYVVQAVRDAGFSYARTTENLCCDLGEDAWHMPTTVQFFPHGIGVLTRNALRYPRVTKVPFIVRRARNADFISFMLSCAEFCAQSQGVFHLWGHSWEIEEHGLWDALDAVMKGVRALTTRSLTLGAAMDVVRR